MYVGRKLTELEGDVWLRGLRKRAEGPTLSSHGGCEDVVRLRLVNEKTQRNLRGGSLSRLGIVRALMQERCCFGFSAMGLVVV